MWNPENFPDDYFHKRGRCLYDPFYTTTTIGCLRFLMQTLPLKMNTKDAVKYGRPLFVVMTTKELMAFEKFAIQRIVRSNTRRWENVESAWLSVLGTRVQMGQTSFSLASKLVGHSYANLVGVTFLDKKQDKSAKIYFAPDSVYVGLAMCLMDDDWSLMCLACQKHFWA